MATMKVTKKEMFAQILAVLTDDAQKDFIKHEIELLEKKASTPRKLTPAQIEAAELRDEITALLKSAESPLTISDIRQAIPALRDEVASPQKISRLIRDIGEDKVSKTYVKKVAYFMWVAD